MDFIQPLELEKIIINIFSGSTGVFTAVAIMVIFGMAAFFRMSNLILVFIIGLFFLMFKGYVDKSIFFIILSLGGLLIGYWVSRIVKG